MNKVNMNTDWEKELQIKEERIEIWEKYKELFSECRAKCGCSKN